MKEIKKKKNSVKHIERECLQCGKILTTTESLNKRWCCPECYSKYRETNKEYKKWLVSKIKKGNELYGVRKKKNDI